MPGQQSNHLPYPQSSTATAAHTEKQYQQPFQTSKIWYEVGCLKPRKPSRKNLKKQAKHYNKSYLGEMVHFDTKRLPLL
jgi:integrase, catalytic domain protein